MEIPIFEEDEKVGMLRVSRAGLYTVFAARLPSAAGADVPGGQTETALSRLWLLNKRGDAASLGLLAPCPAGRVLSRRLTRLECSRLPSPPVKALVLPNGEKPKFPRKGEEERQKNAPAGEKAYSELRIPNSKFCWHRLSDGSLVDPRRRLLALPWSGGKLTRGAHKIVLNDREYWAFRY